jgi:hypothetical protein
VPLNRSDRLGVIVVTLRQASRVGACAAWLVIGGYGGAARAAEWSAEPSVIMRGDYNSNLTLTSAPHSEVWGERVSPGVKFQGSTENLEVSGNAAADYGYSAHPASFKPFRTISFSAFTNGTEVFSDSTLSSLIPKEAAILLYNISIS